MQHQQPSHFSANMSLFLQSNCFALCLSAPACLGYLRSYKFALALHANHISSVQYRFSYAEGYCIDPTVHMGKIVQSCDSATGVELIAMLTSIHIQSDRPRSIPVSTDLLVRLAPA